MEMKYNCKLPSTDFNNVIKPPNNKFFFFISNCLIWISSKSWSPVCIILHIRVYRDSKIGERKKHRVHNSGYIPLIQEIFDFSTRKILHFTFNEIEFQQ